MGVIGSLLRACWQTAIKRPTSPLGAVGLHSLTFNVLAMIVSETPVQLGDADAAVLYYNTSYLTTSFTALPMVSQQTGQETDLLPPFAAIRRVSPFAL